MSSESRDPAPAPIFEFLTVLMAIAKKRNLGHRDIATLSGIDESQISRMTRGLQGLTLATASAIIGIFDGEDQHNLAKAWLHDAIRALGFSPEILPVGKPRSPELADLTDPMLAKTVETLLGRIHTNPGIRTALNALEEMSNPATANGHRRVELSKRLMNPNIARSHKRASR